MDTGESNPGVRLCEILHGAGSCGINLSKSKWDPYPWVGSVEPDSPAAAAGVLQGDCLLEVNGEDMLGLRVAEVASRVRVRGDRATFMVWNSGVDPSCTPESLCCGPMPTNLQRLTTCMSNILEAMECPICLETIPPPAHQCANGHLICFPCRTRTERCPVCRLRFFRGRSILADQVFGSLIDAFDLKDKSEAERSKLLIHRVYGPNRKEKKPKPEIKINLLSPTNKFLTRIMGSGKSSSVENLSGTYVDKNQSENNDYGGLKTKSLSSSEIFIGESQSQVSRASSMLSSRPGSGLLDINDCLSPRPASYHGSAEDLRSRLIADFGLEMPSSRTETCACPMAPTCSSRIPFPSLKQHLFQHNVPLIQYWGSKAKFKLSWLEDGLVTIDCRKSLFFIRAVPNQHLWVWTIDEVNGTQYAATVQIDLEKYHCSIFPLTELNTKELNSQGIPLGDIPRLSNQDPYITVFINDES